jgi:cytochrome c oxidase assembly protein subunit 17
VPETLLLKMGSAEVPLPVAVPSPEIPAMSGGSATVTAAAAPATESKPKKKICCACPDTKRLRDECVVEHGEPACTKWIEAHKRCLRAEGFNV